MTHFIVFNRFADELIVWAFCLGVLLYAGCNGTSPMNNPANLKVEYIRNPVGLETQNPRLSWIIDDHTRGASQTAYQVKVSKDSSDFEGKEALMWDTDKVSSSETINILYQGNTLHSGTKYFWKVRAWNQDEEATPWSEVHSFQMGLLDAGEWQAQWITVADSTVSSPLFRDEFNINKEVSSAYIYTTGMGYYELYLNGQKVGDHVLDPAITNYDRSMLYETYDVAEELNKGSNAFGLWLGNGGFRLKREEGRWTWFGTNNNYGKPMGLLQLHLRYSDGTEEVIGTDASWKTNASPITYNNVYGGEEYDANLEQDGWSQVGFDDQQWKEVQTVTVSDVELRSQVMPPIRVIETIEPVRESNPKPGVFLYDLGQNIPGWWKVRVKGSQGTELKIRGAETLNDSLFPTPLKPGDSLSTKHAYHGNVWTTYTLKGDETESWEPRFFYSGFRYIEVQVDPSEQLDSLEVLGRVVHSDIPRNGHFASSDSLLNRIYEASVWSQRGNLHGYPTDCPHREKGAYNGDGQVIAETSMHDFHMHPFYVKWIEDMRDTQQKNGRILNTSPTILGGTGGGIGWGSAYILMPWWMYQYYEDQQILQEHYPAMQKYMSYLHHLARNDTLPEEQYIINEFGGHWDSLGEWEAPDSRNGPNNPLTNTYYWYLDTITMANIAKVIGKEKDQRRYSALADTIKAAFNEKFFDPQTHLYGPNPPFQSYLFFALAQNLVPEGQQQAVLDNLVEDIMKTRDGHLGTGILGTKHMFDVLMNEGREEVLHTIVTQTTQPSWGHWILNGATTLWESWDAGSSHNHQMFGSVNEYFYKYLAGIRAPTDPNTTTGYKKIHIKPYLPETLNHASATLETVRGILSSKWNREDGKLRLIVTLPANTTGQVSIPVTEPERMVIKEKDIEIWDSGFLGENVEGIKNGAEEGGYVSFEVESGTYEFTVSAPE